MEKPSDPFRFQLKEISWFGRRRPGLSATIVGDGEGRGDLRVTVRRLLAPVVVAAAGLVLAGLAVWYLLAVPWVEARIQGATGYRASVGSLAIGWGRVRLREVTLFGAAPFSSTPLARIAELEVALGGPGYGRLSPSAITARGAQITYLRAGHADNLRGAATHAPPRARSARSPRISVRDARLDAFVRLGLGYSLVGRGGALTLDRPPEGGVTAELDRVALDLPGLLTLAAPRIRLRSEDGHKVVDGQGLRVLLPGGGTLLQGLQLAGELGVENASLSVRGPRAGTDPGLSASFELRGGAAHGSLEVPPMPLAALRPLVRALGVETGEARGGLKAVLQAQPDGRSHLWVDLQAQKLGVAHPRLDRSYWGGLDLAVRGQAVIDPAADRVEVEPTELDLLGFPLVVSGWSERRPRWRGEWKISTRGETPPACADLLAAQAAPIRRALAGMDLRGRMGIGIGLAFDSASWESLNLDIAMDPRCRVEREPAALESLLRVLAGGAAAPALSDLPVGKHHPDFVPRQKMPKHLVSAFLTAEDGRFYNHRGFDLEGIRRALAHDLETATLAKGASTITQQLAKNLFLGPERTLARKLAELVLGWRIDETIPKERQLELYLNVIELGPGIRGVKRAAEVYFGKEVGKLTPLESAHLAALTPNPLGFARRFRDGRVDDGWLNRLYDLLGMMKRSGRLSSAELNSARQSRLQLRRI